MADKKYIQPALYKKIINSVPLCCVDLVIRRGSRFLMVRRAQDPAKKEWWFPGGRVYFNETLLQAAKRKIREEVNIKSFEKLEFLGFKEFGFKKGLYGLPVWSIAGVFFAEVSDQDCADMKPDRTMSDLKWFGSAEPGFRPYLKEFIKKAGF